MSSPACLVKYERTDPGGGGCLSSRASSGSEVHVPVRRTPAVPLAAAAWAASAGRGGYSVLGLLRAVGVCAGFL